MRWLNTIIKSWLGSLIGLLALGSIIYFLGPALSIKGFRPLDSAVYRYLVIGLLFMLWAAWQAWRFWQARQKNRQMINQLVQPSTPSLSPDQVASKEELDQLSERLQEALKHLEKAKAANKDSMHLYELPWYIIIGPPGAGKTTLLANSNLHFPLSDKYGKDAVRGVGGTRNCDWWFTDDAILLDTAGRYTTQDSQQTVDQAAWLGFLKLLKQYRGRQPINGVLIAVSLTDLVQQNPDLQAQHAKAIRQRVQELYEQLGIRFPVYMLFTKADLVAGFTEFFDDLDKEGREQVWGMTFPYQAQAEDNKVGQFSAEFGLLEDRLNQQVIEKIDKERSAERRRALYLFPQQFSSLKENLQRFLDQVFQSNRYEQNVLLRGVYFTSATQEGVPIDRIMVSLANSFGVNPQQLSRFSPQGKSFFINRLLSQVVFKESGLAGRNLQVERKLQWLQSGALVSAVVLGLLALSLWAVSYWHNRQTQQVFLQQVSALQQQVATIPANDTKKVLAALDNIQTLAWDYAPTKPSLSWLSRLGLNQELPLRRAMDDQYQVLLKESLSPQLKQLLEQQINNSLRKPEKADVLMGSLRNYLFLGGQVPAGIAAPAEIQRLDWNNNGQAGDAEDNSIATHTKNLLGLGGTATVDKVLVEEARRSLREIKVDKLAYLALQQKGIEQASSFNFIITDKKNLSGIEQSFHKKSRKSWTNNVPGFFTKQGYEAAFLPNYKKAAEHFANEAWVLGSDVGRLQDSKELAAEYERYYQEAYIAAWRDFLQDITAAPVKDLESAKAVLLGLTSNADNMLFRLMEEVTAQTNFAPSQDKSLVSFSNEKVLPPLVLVDTEFKKLHERTDAKSFQRINQLIDDIYAKLNQPNALGALENNALTNALGELNSEALKLPPLIGDIVKQLTQSVSQQVVGEIQKNLRSDFAQALKEQVGDFCKEQIAKRYPLVATASLGVELANFTSFFNSGGRVAQFIEQQAKSMPVDKTTLQTVQNQLALAIPIRNAFFRTGSLEFLYDIKAVNLSPQFQTVELHTGTQRQIFKNGESKTFKWPDGNKILVQTNLSPPPATPTSATPNATTNPNIGTNEPEIVANEQGDEWLVFRLFEKKKWILPGVVEFQLVAGTDAAFQVATKELRSFKCPSL